MVFFWWAPPPNKKNITMPKITRRTIYTRRELPPWKLAQRRKTPPPEWVVQLMNASLNADSNNEGYVPPPDEKIDELLAAGLKKYLPTRAAVRKWVEGCAHRGWPNGDGCITPQGQGGRLRGPGGRFCKGGAAPRVLAPRVLLIKDKDANLLTPDELKEYVHWLVRIMDKQTARPLLQEEKGANATQSLGKDCTFFDVRHGRADTTYYPKKVYQKMERWGLLARIHVLVADFLNKRGVSSACFEAGRLQHNLVFAHSYEASHATGQDTHGMASHVDDVVYCAAVYCVTGDGGRPGLWWKESKESQEVIQVPMEPGDIALILRGTHHGVADVPRDSPRITVNVLF